jgi:uncharacterized ferritin-like protein (DUF455 family)
MNWAPFRVAPSGSRGDAPRSLDTIEGIGDRLRSAAFAELQAREAFLWAAHHYLEAPEDLKQAWITLSKEEQKHMNWLLNRMTELGIEVTERSVSDQLWYSLITCKTAEEFALYMASAEERGRKAGIRFCEALTAKDPITAKIFGTIAQEEISHIELAARFYPQARTQGIYAKPLQEKAIS